MLLQHFGLREAPFGLTPDTSFLFGSRSHQEAHDTLMVSLESGDGFIKITGEIGTGKTFLCRRLLGSLDDRYLPLFVPNPCDHRRGLLINLCLEMGLPIKFNEPRSQLMPALTEALMARAAEGRTVVACLDEAQAMPDEALEALRLLTNIETEKNRLLRVVMFGQPELDVKLAQPHMRQLAQRISFHYELTGFTGDETLAYLNHRMAAAGHTGATVFGAREAKLLHAITEGTPRLINVVANKALMLAYGCGETVVQVKHIRAAAADTPSTHARGMLAGLASRWSRATAPLSMRWSAT
jgi:MSHA biogenesis protein MshM